MLMDMGSVVLSFTFTVRVKEIFSSVFEGNAAMMLNMSLSDRSGTSSSMTTFCVHLFST